MTRALSITDINKYVYIHNRWPWAFALIDIMNITDTIIDIVNKPTLKFSCEWLKCISSYFQTKECTVRFCSLK